MSRRSDQRRCLVAALGEGLRKMSTRSVLYHQRVALHLGLGPTDHKCLDVLMREGAMTAGRLARQTGLTTGAITGVVDRLAAAGYVHREKDPVDARRVVLRADEKRAYRDIGPVLARMQKRMTKVLAVYGEDELRMLVEFCERCEDAAKAEMESLE